MFGQYNSRRFGATLFVTHLTGFIIMVDNLFSIFIVSNKAVDKNLNRCFIAHVYFKPSPPMTFYDSPYIKHVIMVLRDGFFSIWGVLASRKVKINFL